MEVSKEVSVVEYKPEWLHQFEQDKEDLQKAFGAKAVAIEHIGSTSIMGLPSKPIIDIAVGVVDLTETVGIIIPLDKQNNLQFWKVVVP